MSFIETQFPTDVAYNTTGGPTYSTDIVVLQSGHEQRNANWSQARHQYTVNNVKVLADIETIIDHFHAVQGSLHGFRFKDWADYKSCALADTVAFDDQTIGTGDGIETDYQLVKVYTRGALSYTRTINKPVEASIKVGVNGVEQTLTTHYTVDATTGIITFVTPPPGSQTVTAGYEFDVPARFATDQLNLEHLTCNIASVGLPIIEVRV